MSGPSPGVIPVAEPNARRSNIHWLYGVFVASGFAALLYQVTWQRALFAIFGINIESVTVIVTAFMLGLGVGGLLGGALSKLPGAPLLLIFGAVEGAIGLYGAFSLRLFDAVGLATLHLSGFSTTLIALLLVLIPTTLMGTTLPLLVAHAVRVTGNVGRSVGILYFVNTLGSALAAMAAVLVFMPRLALSGTIQLGVALNGLVALVVLSRHAIQARAV